MIKRLPHAPTLRIAAAAVLLFAALSATGDATATRSMLGIGDLHWQGMFSFPAVGNATSTGPGTMSYASGALAVRYVSGQRRFISPTFKNGDSIGQTWGDLVEWAAPSASPYTGSDTTAAPTLVETRRWKNWTLYASTPQWQDANSGVRIGGLYWDEANGVLWYQLYAYYSGVNRPLIGATKLLDAADSASGGDYVQIGTKYGPWWYGSNDPADQRLFWKGADYWIIPVPSDTQAVMGGRNMIIGAGVGAVGGAGHIGPGFTAIGQPSLTDAPNTVIPLGLGLADYTFQSTQNPSNARRNPNYSVTPWPGEGGGLWNPRNGVGFWVMSLDQINSFAWVQTPTKEGIVLFGRQSHGYVAYGHNPLSSNVGWAGSGSPDFVDPSRANPDPSNGYLAQSFGTTLLAFDASQVRQVAQGTRSRYSDGINPIELGDWHQTWPNIPLSQYSDGGPVARPIYSMVSNTAFWDATTQQLIWVQPASYSYAQPRPTLQIFTVIPPPPAPANFRIIGKTP